MDKRTKAAYSAVFDFINTKIFDLAGTKMFYTDFELAIRNALREKYPASKLSTCHFHFAQAVQKNASKIKGLTEFIRENESARNIYYRFIYLALLPPNDIIPMFNHLKSEVKDLSNTKMTKFVSYFCRQWIKKEGPQKISVFENDIRTTSSAEGYNRALNDYCRKKGSFPWFCVSIRNQEYMKRAEFTGFVASGGILGNKRKKSDVVIIYSNIFIENR